MISTSQKEICLLLVSLTLLPLKETPEQSTVVHWPFAVAAAAPQRLQVPKSSQICTFNPSINVAMVKSNVAITILRKTILFLVGVF